MDNTAVSGSYHGVEIGSPEFDALYAYDGNDLGFEWNPDATTFRLWAPTAAQVSLNLYDSDQSSDAPLRESVAMARHDKGVWSATVLGDLRDQAYDYQVTFEDGSSNTTPDPYAIAAVVNGHRSVVLAPEQMTIPDFPRMPHFSSLQTDARIAELSVRDSTISPTSGVSEAHRGKFLGLTEKGTTNSFGKSTGLDYLVKLGITHVQIMPMYDFESVDETKPFSDDNYNWGYDPLNYNVPEGSFSTNPYDPATRIREAKLMVRALHEAGIRVVMDVVYNHVYSLKTHPLALSVPGYFFRTVDGKLTSRSFCGNDVASERAMGRKYIIDSLRYWIENFRLDGIRFDILGLIDNETIRQARAMMDEIDTSILAYGEGWDMHADLPTEQMTVQEYANLVDNQEGRGSRTGSTVGFFNDSLRDNLKGADFDSEPTSRGFVTGEPGKERIIAYNMLGTQPTQDEEIVKSHGTAMNHADASQVVQYAEIHDGMTLFDKLAISLGYAELDEQGNPITSSPVLRNLDGEKLQDVARRQMLATAAALLAQGVPEIQLGQEFLRTKDGEHNSYNTGDTQNAIDWNRLANPVAARVARFVRDLWALRASTPAFRYSSYQQINAHASVLAMENGVVAWRVSDESHAYTVVLNANEVPQRVREVSSGYYEVLCENSEVVEPRALEVAHGFTAAGLSVNVLRRSVL